MFYSGANCSCKIPKCSPTSSQLYGWGNYAYNSLHYFYSEFPVIPLHYAQNYSQDHCQDNPGALKIIIYCKVWLFHWSNDNTTHVLVY